MLALSRLAIVLDTDADEPSLKILQALIPQMILVLKQAVDEGDEERATQSFEVFQTLLGCDSTILNPAFGDLIQFMITLAATKTLDEDARTQALNFLMQCVRYRKLKMQSLKVGEQLTLKSLEIVTEIGDGALEDDDMTTPRCALGLLDEMATTLPPSQVVVPLLHNLGPYVTSSDPDRRQAGIMALGMIVEGAPDFINTQLHEIFPLVMRLLGDREMKVRRAALDCVMRIAEELPEELGKEHQKLMPAVVIHLDNATKSLTGPEDKANMDTIKACTNCIDCLVEGMDSDDIEPYISELMSRLTQLYQHHPDFKIKAVAIQAIGNVAACAKSAFLPYFEDTMNSLSEYVELKDSAEELDLRSTTCDSMGSMALAVGPREFQRYVRPLMLATMEGTKLDHPKLKETSYLFWGTMAKVYEGEFKAFLGDVLEALFECLATEESELEVDLGDEAEDLAGKEITIGGKKIKVAALSNDDIVSAEDIEDLDDEIAEADSDDDWDDMDIVTAVAQEKEIAVEALGEILTHTTRDYLPYMEKTVETVVPLLEHSYEGVQKAAISTLFRAYTAVWSLQSDEQKRGQPSSQIQQLGGIVMTGTLGIWQEEEDRFVILRIFRTPSSFTALYRNDDIQVVNPSSLRCTTVPDEKTNLLLTIFLIREHTSVQFPLLFSMLTSISRGTVVEINRSLAETLTVTGHSLLSDIGTLKHVCEILHSILNKNHSCQKDFGDEEDLGLFDETSEFDWATIDSALDVLIGVAKALGRDFDKIWKEFEKPLLKFASGSDSKERSTSVGVIAECIRAMGPAITPFTTTLLKTILHRMSDEDPQTKSNAAFAAGLLQEKSTNDQEILKAFPTILSKLEPLLSTEEARCKDNAAGCVSRMIMKHPSKIPIAQVLPALIDILPLREDFEENEPIYDMIVKLCM